MSTLQGLEKFMKKTAEFGMDISPSNKEKMKKEKSYGSLKKLPPKPSNESQNSKKKSQKNFITESEFKDGL